MARSKKKLAMVLVVNAIIVTLFVVGSMMMYQAVAYENYNNDLFMQSIGLLVVAATIGVRTIPSLTIFFRRSKAATLSLGEKTMKMLAYAPDKERSGQQA